MLCDLLRRPWLSVTVTPGNSLGDEVNLSLLGRALGRGWVAVLVSGAFSEPCKELNPLRKSLH